MALTVFLSFSVIALAVTARPVLPQDAPLFDRPMLDVQRAVQAVFQARAGQPREQDKEFYIHVTTLKEHTDALDELSELDAIKAIVPLAAPAGADVHESSNLLSTASLNDIDGGERPLAGSEFNTPSQMPEVLPIANSPTYSAPLLVLALSCAAAFLVLTFVSAGLYTAHFLRKRVLASDMAWELLPRFEKHEPLGDISPAEPSNPVDSFPTEKSLFLVPEVPAAPSLEPPDEKFSDCLSDVGDDDEKFHDAQDPSSFSVRSDRQELPRIVIQPHQTLAPLQVHPDPDFLPLPTRAPTPYATPPPTPPRSPSALQMREIPASTPVSAPTPVAKPAWSLRAADAPALGLSRTSSPVPFADVLPRIPGSLIPFIEASSPRYDEKRLADPAEAEQARRGRAYRDPVPELDIALAMQLRPGLGIGADSAWLVRFLMAMFGWMSVLIGNVPDVGRQRRAIRA